MGGEDSKLEQASVRHLFNKREKLLVIQLSLNEINVTQGFKRNLPTSARSTQIFILLYIFTAHEHLIISRD